MQLPCRRLRRPRRVLRQGPAASCSAAMASRVSVSGVPGDASPGSATTSVVTTVSASIKDSALSRRAPRVVRWSREAAALPCWMLHAARQRAAHPSRFAPAAFRPRGVSVPAGCISPCDPRYLRIAGRVALGLRLPQATTAAPVPDSRRLSGLPVCRSGLQPYRHTAAPKRRQCTAGTKAAPEQNV